MEIHRLTMEKASISLPSLSGTLVLTLGEPAHDARAHNAALAPVVVAARVRHLDDVSRTQAQLVRLPRSVVIQRLGHEKLQE